MKRVVSLILSGLLGFSFAECTPPTQPPIEPPPSQETDEPFVPREELTKVTIGGVDIGEYDIVYDEEDLHAKYCAENLAYLLADVANASFDVFPDSVQEQPYEILIGDTNRSESVLDEIEWQENQYVFGFSNNKVIMQAEGYIVGGAANHLVNEVIVPAQEGTEAAVTLAEGSSAYTYAFQKARNAILLIGDGMGDNHIKQAVNTKTIPAFYAESMPHATKVTTYSYSVHIGEAAYTDSAAAATALSTGYKTLNGYLGMDASRLTLTNVREVARQKGAKTAVLTTDQITGATPAGFTVHDVTRTQTQEIQSQIDALLASGELTVGEGDLGDALCARAKVALDTVSKDESCFFMMLEEGWIDKYSHDNLMDEMLSAMARFNDVIAYVMQFVLMHPDTVLLVTADHETGNLSPHIRYPNKYVFNSGNHTNTDVSLFAMGAGAEVLTQADKIDNVAIPKFIASVFGQKNFGGSGLK